VTSRSFSVPAARRLVRELLHKGGKRVWFDLRPPLG
jgi:hypothetical protein